MTTLPAPAAPAPPAPRRPYWVLIVAAIYLVLLLALFAFAAFAATSSAEGALIAATITTTLMLTLAALLFAPIQAARRRRVTRRTIWIPLIATGLLAALLFLAGALAVGEWLKSNEGGPLVIATAIAIWILWATLFYGVVRLKGIWRVARSLHHFLFAATILELIVAVCCHIVVRRRHECCAGIATGLAICTGAVLAVIVIGPAVAFLIADRWQKIRPHPPRPRGFNIEITPPISPSE